MRPVFIASDHLLSSLGFSTQAHVEALMNERTGISLHKNHSFLKKEVFASLIDESPLKELSEVFDPTQNFTRLERMMLFSIRQSLKQTGIKLHKPRTLLIISTTKGNIDLLASKGASTRPSKRLYLGTLAKTIGQELECSHQPLVISNACISAALGIIIAARLIRANKYDHIVVCGADMVSEFIISGFQALKAMSPNPCRPYDQAREGITLGEGCGTLILTADSAKARDTPIQLIGGATSNDANHISGPSRTAEGLYQAIKQCLTEANISPNNIDFLSAHGTATQYNDEMEAIACQRAGLLAAPINSFKGYFGHTLGAAGVLESVLSIRSMQNNTLFKSLGYETSGTSYPLNIITHTQKSEINYCLKTASGFGGCNAALLFAKYS